MKYLNKLIKFIKNPDYRFNILAHFGFFNHWSDEKFLKRKFKSVFGYELDVNNPQTFNEKLQWLKLYDRNPLYTTLVDKYAVKKWVADKIGEQYIIPTIGVWDSADEIDFDKLPNQFVLKTTHDSGGVFICHDKNTFNKSAVLKELTKSLKRNYYLTNREWPYKDVPRKIIAEKYMVDEKSHELRDYKFFCFNGNVDNVMVCIDRNTGYPKFYFFDKNWTLLRLNKRGQEAPKDFTLDKPPHIDDMSRIAHTLSKNIPFVRIDLYSCNSQVYFGEVTFYPQSGFDNNLLPTTDSYFGNLIHLSSNRSKI